MKGASQSWLPRATKTVLGLISVEMVLGGGGRLLAWGPISARMLLFAAAMVLTVFWWVRGAKLPREYNALLGIFTVMLGIGVVMGYSSGAAWNAIAEDVKPLLYFYLLPFLYFSLDDPQLIDRLARWFQLGGLILAALFCSLLIAIHSGLLPFLSFYHTVDPTGEFFFRGEITFFYKGFLYLCVALIFLISDTKRRTWIAPVLLAIILSATRGFWIALLMTYSAYSIFLKQGGLKSIISGVCAFLAAMILIVYSQQMISAVSEWLDGQSEQPQVEQSNHAPRPFLLGDREHSDNVRKRQFREVIDQTTGVSTFVGHGFGIGVPTRPIHMEISYLEIFHKQGLLGLLVWLAILSVGFKKYLLAASEKWATPFFLSFVFVFIQSLSNQYVNNPIGLFMVLAALVALDRLVKNVPRDANNTHGG